MVNCFGVFFASFAYRYFFMFLYFLKTIQLPHINFFTCILCITLRVASLKKLFSSTGSHFQVLWGLFWFMFIHFFGDAPSYVMKFCLSVFCITLKINVLKRISQHLSLWLEVLCSTFGPVLSIFLHVLGNIKHSFNILHERPDIMWSTLIKKYVGSTSALNILGYFG